jgi:hypothetical protein
MTIGCIKPTFIPTTPSLRPGQRFFEPDLPDVDQFEQYVSIVPAHISKVVAGSRCVLWASAAQLWVAIAARPARRGHAGCPDNNRLWVQISV